MNWMKCFVPRLWLNGYEDSGHDWYANDEINQDKLINRQTLANNQYGYIVEIIDEMHYNCDN